MGTATRSSAQRVEIWHPRPNCKRAPFSYSYAESAGFDFCSVSLVFTGMEHGNVHCLYLVVLYSSCRYYAVSSHNTAGYEVRKDITTRDRENPRTQLDLQPLSPLFYIHYPQTLLSMSKTRKRAGTETATKFAPPSKKTRPRKSDTVPKDTTIKDGSKTATTTCTQSTANKKGTSKTASVNQPEPAPTAKTRACIKDAGADAARVADVLEEEGVAIVGGGGGEAGGDGDDGSGGDGDDDGEEEEEEEEEEVDSEVELGASGPILPCPAETNG